MQVRKTLTKTVIQGVSVKNATRDQERLTELGDRGAKAPLSALTQRAKAHYCSNIGPCTVVIGRLCSELHSG